MQFTGLLVGNNALLFSATGSVPAANDKTDAFGEVGSSPKPCCGCLGRDTIANAAARIGPAVVNLSVPKGML